MSSEWPTVAIDQVCKLIVDCVNKTAPIVEMSTPYRMIRTTNIRNGRVDLTSCRFVDEATYAKWTRRASLQYGDVLLTREAPIGEIGFVEEPRHICQVLGQFSISLANSSRDRARIRPSASLNMPNLGNFYKTTSFHITTKYKGSLAYRRRRYQKASLGFHRSMQVGGDPPKKQTQCQIATQTPSTALAHYVAVTYTGLCAAPWIDLQVFLYPYTATAARHICANGKGTCCARLTQQTEMPPPVTLVLSQRARTSTGSASPSLRGHLALPWSWSSWRLVGNRVQTIQVPVQQRKNN